MSASQKVRAGMLVLSLAGVGFIASHEGTEPVAYLDAVGVPTICTGSTKNVFIGHVATPLECAQRLQEDTTYAGKAVARLVTVPVSQGQYDALVSFVFNVGPGNFSESTLLKKLNLGQCRAAAAEFLKWDKAKGRRLRGLTVRRKHESDLFIKDCE